MCSLFFLTSITPAFAAATSGVTEQQADAIAAEYGYKKISKKRGEKSGARLVQVKSEKQLRAFFSLDNDNSKSSSRIIQYGHHRKSSKKSHKKSHKKTHKKSRKKSHKKSHKKTHKKSRKKSRKKRSKKRRRSVSTHTKHVKKSLWPIMPPVAHIWGNVVFAKKGTRIQHVKQLWTQQTGVRAIGWEQTAAWTNIHRGRRSGTATFEGNRVYGVDVHGLPLYYAKDTTFHMSFR